MCPIEVGVEEELVLLDDQPLLRGSLITKRSAPPDALAVVEGLETLVADDDLVASVGCSAHESFGLAFWVDFGPCAPPRPTRSANRAPQPFAGRPLLSTARPRSLWRRGAHDRDGRRASGRATRDRPLGRTTASDCSTRRSRAATAMAVPRARTPARQASRGAPPFLPRSVDASRGLRLSRDLFAVARPIVRRRPPGLRHLLLLTARPGSCSQGPAACRRGMLVIEAPCATSAARRGEVSRPVAVRVSRRRRLLVLDDETAQGAASSSRRS